MLPAVLWTAGCFDAHAVDEGPWIIDDFEDGDLNPADRNFGPWVAFTWPQQNVHDPVLDDGDQSTFSLALDVNVFNPADGSADSVGAGVQTGLAVTPEDLSRFSEMVFSAKTRPRCSRVAQHDQLLGAPRLQHGAAPIGTGRPPAISMPSNCSTSRRTGSWSSYPCRVLFATLPVNARSGRARPPASGTSTSLISKSNRFWRPVNRPLAGWTSTRSAFGEIDGGLPMKASSVSVMFVVFVASSCFDAHQVDPGVLVVDDFDHGAFPVDSTFLPWQCFSFNPNGTRTYSCVYDNDTPTYGSMYSLRLDFEVADPMNGIREYGGAGLVTYSLFGLWQDFTAFATLGFGARLQSGIPALPSNTNVNVVLGCSTLADGTPAVNRYVVQRLEVRRRRELGAGRGVVRQFQPGYRDQAGAWLTASGGSIRSPSRSCRTSRTVSRPPAPSISTTST